MTDGVTAEEWADAWDVRPLIDARIKRAKAEALREAAIATLSMTYPTSADPDVWGAWLIERADAVECDSVHGQDEDQTPPGTLVLCPNGATCTTLLKCAERGCNAPTREHRAGRPSEVPHD